MSRVDAVVEQLAPLLDRLDAEQIRHMEQRIVFDPPRPAFDVLVVAGDVSDLITRSIRMVSALAAGKPAVFVAGNHEWWAGPETIAEKRDAAQFAAQKHSVHFLEGDAVDIAGVRFAGATLWRPDDPRFVPSVVSLAAARAEKRKHLDRAVDRPVDILVDQGVEVFDLAFVDGAMQRARKTPETMLCHVGFPKTGLAISKRP